MFNLNIISASIPHLNPDDPVYRALQYMNDFHVAHLPVVDGEDLLGLVHEDLLFDTPDDDAPMRSLIGGFQQIQIGAGQHIFDTLQLMTDQQLSTIPVVGEDGKFAGTISQSDLMRELAMVTGASEKGAMIGLEMDKQQFSFSEIARLVETNDAYITQLNSFQHPNNGTFLVILRLNKFEISDVMATLQRFEYKVRFHFGAEKFEDELKSNYDHLMNYLQI